MVGDAGPSARRHHHLRGAGGRPVGGHPHCAGRGAPAAAPPAAAARTTSAVPGASSAGGSQKSRHECVSCHAAFVVRYEARGDESEETVPVACPHCWHRNYVLVAESAAESREYTAEKA